VLAGTALVAAMLVTVRPAAADDAATCQSLETAIPAKIEACTRVVDSGSAQTYTLSMVYFSRSVAYEKLGDMDHAMADLDAAIRTRPNELFHAIRGGWYEARRNFPAAIADYTEAIRLSTMPSLAYGRRIHAYRAMGDLDAALADCDAVVALTPKSAAYRVLRGDVYRQRGDLDHAIADYREALRLDPNHRAAAQKLADAERERT
jgi:tetratricopeptide (TPR) repeat protein